MKLKTKADEKGDKIALTVRRLFRDGAFNADFLELGYPPVWKPGKKRFLPRVLIEKLEGRGYEMQLAKDEPEDFIAPESFDDGTKPNPSEKYAGEPLITCIAIHAFRDGKFAGDLLLYGYPAEWKKGERREIPAHLFAAIQKRTGALSTKEEDLKEYEHLIPKHEFQNRQWLEEKSNELAVQKAAYDAKRRAEQNEAEKAKRRAELGI